ncbi:predicted protein [Lichtheimia corymbifera JMRC:FSU:9682]|uniref:Uncharacterized protein n=1 Tax=Lichtheimia corymbifera JMRC:FSU:9682 TaxID=1263082 RepID=A0A068S2X5_9FUNG|nr:predicted protein [Lichtheimia corymbifera JMRC:FSU:9682]
MENIIILGVHASFPKYHGNQKANPSGARRCLKHVKETHNPEAPTTFFCFTFDTHEIPTHSHNQAIVIVFKDKSPFIPTLKAVFSRQVNNEQVVVSLIHMKNAQRPGQDDGTPFVVHMTRVLSFHLDQVALKRSNGSSRKSNTMHDIWISLIVDTAVHINLKKQHRSCNDILPSLPLNVHNNE